MVDEARNGNRTKAGVEVALDNHERRLEGLEAWRQLAEYKAAARDRRAQNAVRWVTTLSVGIIVAIVSTLLAAGGHF